jgi:hypothetical protein
MGPDSGRQETALFRDRLECEMFVRYVLSDEATRTPAKNRHQNNPLNGIHIGYGIRCGFRGSDRAERIFVCITALVSMESDLNSACVYVAGLLENELGKSRRGRPSGRQRSGELSNKVETVRSIFNSRGKLAAPSAPYVSGFRSWRAWALTINEAGLESFTEKFAKERGGQATTRWRSAIEEVREKYSGYKDQIEKRWAEVLERFAVPVGAERALRDPLLNPTWVEAVLDALMTGGETIATFRDEDSLCANSTWVSLLTSKRIEENPSDPALK